MYSPPASSDLVDFRMVTRMEHNIGKFRAPLPASSANPFASVTPAKLSAVLCRILKSTDPVESMMRTIGQSLLRLAVNRLSPFSAPGCGSD